MSNPDTLPAPIVAAHKRMAFGFQRLTDDEATRLLECATAEFHRANNLDTVLRLEVQRGNRIELESADFAKRTLAENARLERVNRWQRWALYASAVWWAVVIVLIALWSAYASP